MKRKRLFFSRTELSDNSQKHTGRCKNTVFGNQLKTLFLYLQDHIATASMIAKVTGILKKYLQIQKRFRKSWDCFGK